LSKRKDVLALKSRQDIYNAIQTSPGLHFRGILRKLNMSEGTVRYHLNYLKKRNLIIEKNDGGYLRFFVNDSFGNGDKELMSILRNKVQRYIVFNILINMAGSCTKISEELELSSEVIRYHIQKLVDAGIIKKAKVEDGYVNVEYDKARSKQYFANTSEVVFVLSDYNKLNDFLITNKHMFEDQITCEIISYAINIGKQKPHRKKVGAFEKELDKTINALYEIFPMPFYNL
jgi:DNA-binding Lrp family transcriptional regulator